MAAFSFAFQIIADPAKRARQHLSQRGDFAKTTNPGASPGFVVWLWA
jgi:hypothetical protein